MDCVCFSIDRSLHRSFLSNCPFPSFLDTFSDILDIVCGGSWDALTCLSLKRLFDDFLDRNTDGAVNLHQRLWIKKLGCFLYSVCFLPACPPCLSEVIHPFLWVVYGDEFFPGPLLERVECVSSLGSSVVVLKLLPYHSAPFGASRPPVFCWPTSLITLSPVPLGVAIDPALHSLSSPYSPFQRPPSVLLVVPGCDPPWSLFFLHPGVDPPSVLLVVPGCDPPRSLVSFPPGVDPPWHLWFSLGFFLVVLSGFLLVPLVLCGSSSLLFPFGSFRVLFLALATPPFLQQAKSRTLLVSFGFGCGSCLFYPLGFEFAPWWLSLLQAPLPTCLLW